MKESVHLPFEPVVEPVLSNAPTERSAAERQRSRQQALLETLARARSHIQEGAPRPRSFHEGLIVVIATYNDGRPMLDPGARINTIHHLLLALEHQRADLPASAQGNFKVVIADNGMTPNQRSRLVDYFGALSTQARTHRRSPPKCLMVAAPRIWGDDFTRTAGYARNLALREIRRRRDDGDATFDAPVLIHDDDAVTDGIGDMYRLLSRHRNVLGAVAPGVRGVRDIASHASRIRGRRTEPRRGTSVQSSSFPPVFDQGGFINFSILFAFGGSRVPKTCALLLHPRAIEDLASEEGEVFHVWKKGSFEDMSCSIGLACSDWDIFSCRSAHAYDQVRSHPEARLRQQFAWAYDHATAFHDFSEVSKELPEPVVHHGISVLAPLPKEVRTREEGWGLQRMLRLRGFPGLQATIVRPDEVRETLSYIREQLNTSRRTRRFLKKHSYVLEGGFETARNLSATVRLTLKVVGKIIAQFDPARLIRIEVPFVDYRRAYRPSGERSGHADALRFERDTRVARLLGNLASMYRNPFNDFRKGKIRSMACGPRQAT